MMTRQWRIVLRLVPGVLLTMMMLPSPADAQVVRVTRSDARHKINFNLGYFALKGADGRDSEDVLLPNIQDFATRDDFERLEVGDFNNLQFGGEWLYTVSDYLEVGAGLGYYQKKVETVYADLVDIDGTEIEQDLKLRIVPITGTVRFLPLGRDSAVEPYVGGGIGLFQYRYSEIGEFVADNGDIFSNVTDPTVKDGTAFGPVIVAGLRGAVGDAWLIGGEIRWQSAKGKDLLEEGFIRDEIDLGGWTTSFTFGVRF